MTEFIPAAKPIVGDEERAAVDAVLASGMLAQGAEVATFEQEFSGSSSTAAPSSQ
jgi:perosamine synthetase